MGTRPAQAELTGTKEIEQCRRGPNRTTAIHFPGLNIRGQGQVELTQNRNRNRGLRVRFGGVNRAKRALEKVLVFVVPEENGPKVAGV